jgi:membrane-bound metal-dependent hydrolase YbcI (DUF457 family)
MWRSHMVLGASSWLAAQTAATAVSSTTLDSAQRASGALVAAGAALLCDLDTPTSRLANTLGPITRTTARLIGRVFGGHRHGTHSIAFCLLTGALSTLTFTTAQPVHITDTVTLSVGELAALAVVYLAAALSAGALLAWHGPRAATLAVLNTAAVAAAHPSTAVLSAAVTIGCASHLLADLLTPEGIVPWWPLSRRRFCLALIRRTGDLRETVLVTVTAVVTIAITSGYP